jgi:flavin reductase (DIM6/NTAB) family NADH-FMN oxidoreductase RutF
MAATAPALDRADEPGMQRMPLSTRQDVEDTFTRSPTSLAAVAARVGGELVGMVASTFETGVSFDPPRALLSVRSGSRTWRALRRSRTAAPLFL